MERHAITLKKIRANIRKHRLEKQLKQEYLGRQIGLCKSGISRLENGKRGTSINKLLILADVLEVHPQDLFQ